MPNKEIIIKVSNDRIFLNPEIVVPIENTNIPVSNLSFKSYKDIYWKVEMVDYNNSNKCLRIKVTDFEVMDFIDFINQVQKKEVKALLFEKMDWKKLEPFLSSYRKNSLTDFVYNTVFVPISTSIRNPVKSNWPDLPIKKFPVIKQNKSYSESSSIPSLLPVTSKFDFAYTFDIAFDESTFILGHVTFIRKIERFDKDITFNISNIYILPEFDNIKNWFAKKLNIKKFKVSIKITISNGLITDTVALSEHIDQITPELIERIQYARTHVIGKTRRSRNTEKALYSFQELLEMSSKELGNLNIFNQTEADILQTLIDKDNVRNKKQIQYLAEDKQHTDRKIKFTLDSPFGFLFFVEGSKNNYYVWELLNSHATYIWSIEKNKESLEYQYDKIERAINSIKDIGRENYKIEYQKNKTQNIDLLFYSINHKDIDSQSTQGFEQWKSKIELCLI